MKIGDKEYSIHPLTPETYEQWAGYVTTLAKRNDQPVARFLARHLRGISGDDRRDVLAAWMATPRWDAPDEDTFDEAAGSLVATQFLATFCLSPSPTWEEAQSLITESNMEELKRLVGAATNPSDDDLASANRALRERIEAAHKSAEPSTAQEG